jgi:hypothetical protein
MLLVTAAAEAKSIRSSEPQRFDNLNMQTLNKVHF